jgi:NifU-like protein involved in Fe-S cluster formation
VDEVIVKYYRKIIREGCINTGSLENPSIFLDSIGEKMSICAKIARSYIRLYINVKDNTIQDIKYLCMCDPTANVAVEILCNLVKSKTFDYIQLITEDSFTQVVGGHSEDLLKRAKGLIELLNIGIKRYQSECA